MPLKPGGQTPTLMILKGQELQVGTPNFALCTVFRDCHYDPKFQSVRSLQIVQFQIRLLLEKQSDQGLHHLQYLLIIIRKFTSDLYLILCCRCIRISCISLGGGGGGGVEKYWIIIILILMLILSVIYCRISQLHSARSSTRRGDNHSQ